jgi:uncharacterized protein
MSESNRLIGIDLAYILSIIGCIVAGYLFIIGGRVTLLDHDYFCVFFDVLPAMFFFLNGFTTSLTLRDRRVSSRKLLRYLRKRGSVMMVIGLALCPFWPLNIFLMTGFMYFSALYIGQLNNTLMRILLLVVILLSILFLYIDVPAFVEFAPLKLEGGGLYDLAGFMFFNGYYSICPWFAFFIAGLLHGRSELRPRGWLPPSSIVGVALIALAYPVQKYSQQIFTKSIRYKPDDFGIINYKLLSPSFVALAIGISIVLTNAFIYIFRRLNNKKILKQIQMYSSMKYSMIFIYTFLGLLTTRIINLESFKSKLAISIYIIVATSLTFILSALWKKRVNDLGPMEWLVKRISGSSKA